MLSLDECRQFLGSEAKGLSDGQLRELRDQLCAIADVALDVAEGLHPEERLEAEPCAEPSGQTAPGIRRPRALTTDDRPL